ncbi:SRPBCC family protein [Luethyella okanaganae]|uniref:SRPBCC family protein n=1 Tax=Luethyella okanaganae TaxID=69372 RepID=A0ABW1VJJ9_9MICO
MPHASRTIVIDRPVSDVFAFFADAENDPRWRRGVLEIERNGPLGVGASYRQRVSGPGGRAIVADFEVTAYEPETRVAILTTAGPVRPTAVYEFRATEVGTEVVFTLDAQLSGVKKLVMSGMVQKTMDAELAALDGAKRILESEA